MNEILELVETLCRDNYLVYKVRMKAILVSKGLWEAIDPTVEDKNQTNRSKSDSALALIILALNEERIVHVEDLNTSR